MTVIQALHRLSQEDCHEFQASLGYIVRTYPKKKERWAKRREIEKEIIESR